MLKPSQGLDAKSQKVTSTVACGQSNSQAGPVSRGEEVALGLWARAGMQ